MLVQILKVDQDIYHGHSPRLLSCLIKTKLHKQLAPLPETQLQIIFSNGDVRYLMFPSRILSYSQRGISSPRKCLYLKLNNKIMLKVNFLQRVHSRERESTEQWWIWPTNCIAMLSENQQCLPPPESMILMVFMFRWHKNRIQNGPK